MKRLFVSLVATLAAISLVLAGCSPSAAPAPTTAPAAPTKAADAPKAAADATKPAAAVAPAQAPTQALATKVDFPAKGKSISLIVPYTPGGSSDVFSRMVGDPLSKELGVPVQIVNKGGAGAQIGITELAAAKPDGYTIGYTPLPTTSSIYLDPARQSAFTINSFAPIALLAYDAVLIAVKADSPYKSLKDLVDASKANPDKIRVGVTGLLSTPDLGLKLFQEVSGTQLARVQFPGGAESGTALLGGHIESRVDLVADVIGQVLGNEIRVLAILDKQPSRLLPNVPTAESQGFKVYAMPSSRIFSAPAGTPKEMIDILANAMKKVGASDELKGKADKLGFEMRYLGPDETAKYWVDADPETLRLMK